MKKLEKLELEILKKGKIKKMTNLFDLMKIICKKASSKYYIILRE